LEGSFHALPYHVVAMHLYYRFPGTFDLLILIFVGCRVFIRNKQKQNSDLHSLVPWASGNVIH